MENQEKEETQQEQNERLEEEKAKDWEILCQRLNIKID